MLRYAIMDRTLVALLACHHSHVCSESTSTGCESMKIGQNAAEFHIAVGLQLITTYTQTIDRPTIGRQITGCAAFCGLTACCLESIAGVLVVSVNRYSTSTQTVAHIQQ